MVEKAVTANVNVNVMQIAQKHGPKPLSILKKKAVVCYEHCVRAGVTNMVPVGTKLPPRTT